MKLLASFFSKLYCYVTAFVVIGSPLFFIPNSVFMPDVTYQITMTVAIAIALASYVLSAIINRAWHTVSKLEFLAYVLFAVALLGSVIFARNPLFSVFGDSLTTYSAAAFFELLAVMYLVRALPETMRHRLKIILIGILGIASVIFVCLTVFTGQIMEVAAKLFSGFTSPTSLSVYIGIFVLAMFIFVKKSRLSPAVRVTVGFSAVVILAISIAISANNDIRPNLESSLLVGKEVLMHDGVFGVGANGYARAWQLYRPQNVIDSQYFATDFSQGFGTIFTLFTTLGIFGVLAFILLGLTALYSTFRSYRETQDEEEKTILGILFIILLYFALIAWVVPLSFAMLVTWMAIAGLGLARAKLSSYHPNKALALVLVPAAIVCVMYGYVTLARTRAFMVFNQAQVMYANQGESAEVENLLARAMSTYSHESMYRWQIEYIINKERILIGKQTNDQEALKKVYLENAQVAVDAGLQAVKLNPDNYQNYVSLGRAYELALPFDKENAYSRAKTSYEEAIKLYPDNPYLYVMLARLEASAGTKEGIRLQLTEALKKKQNFADALYLMSQLEASESRGNEALAYALEAVKNAPNDPLVYIQAGLLFYGKKDYQNAVNALTLALQKDPNNANVAYFLALSLRDGGRPDLAKQIGQELLKRNPGNSDLEAFLRSVDEQNKPAAAKK